LLLPIKLQQLSYVLWAFGHSTLLLIKLQELFRWVGWGVFASNLWCSGHGFNSPTSYLISKNELQSMKLGLRISNYEISMWTLLYIIDMYIYSLSKIWKFDKCIMNEKFQWMHNHIYNFIRECLKYPDAYLLFIF
jgi:hypothetical protein